MADSGPRIGIYPGTFDPITNGHMDIIRRAINLVDQLVIAVSVNAGKGPLFDVTERLEMMREEIADPRNGLPAAKVKAVSFDNLLMHFAEQQGARIIVRGLRAVSDFEYEFQMAGMNTHLNPRIETVFLMASEGSQFISSRFVKEIGKLGGAIDQFVSPRIADRLKARFAAE
ncbi:MAG TPA: pantetheine-phosphate adenylyltransferase [Dongiaceae bacterium]|nr:pantetheine-phosphate adenylyltransferase [Dongiaceae bacterium]